MRTIGVICSAVLLLASVSGIPVGASDISVDEVSVTNDAVITSAGLITKYSLSVSKNSGKLCINGSTLAATTMQTIGFTDIVVERSSNGSTGWTTVSSLDNETNSAAISCYITNKLVTVSSGYYYRVSCNHYAKETGWFFPQSQSVANTSNAVYIS